MKFYNGNVSVKLEAIIGIIQQFQSQHPRTHLILWTNFNAFTQQASQNSHQFLIKDWLFKFDDSYLEWIEY